MLKRIRLAATAALIAVTPVCHAATEPAQAAVADADIAATTYTNFKQVVTEHIALDLVVDFDHQTLSGTAELKLHRLAAETRQIVLDTQSLDIQSVEVRNSHGDWKPASFHLGADDAVLGAPLSIELAADSERIRIHYSTRPEASGLQWLVATQTAGKKFPFLFSQSEAIHARSWIPLQDTPSVRSTYEASIRTPKGLRAVMSAEMNDHPGADGSWHFRMPQPIPGYLIALAVGDIGFQATGSRTGVYAEPSMLAKAAYEFAETGKTIDLAEKTYGPYRWGRYDILVLPPSFPFGGMENPRLTFATPTVITGDRKLVSLITHELAHSWSGNLVTNASWSDFWLNEGFTQYLTYRLTDAQFGQQLGDAERVLGYADLQEDMASADPADRPLYRPTPAKDPDAVYSTIPYERGALFLTWLETRFGRAEFDRFLHGWFADHAFKSATTREFVDYLQTRLVDRHPGKVSLEQIKAWINDENLPSFAVLPSSPALEKIDALRTDWSAGRVATDQLPGDRWTIQEWQRFLDKLPAAVTLPQIKALDAQFKLTGTSNAILASSWYRQAVAHGDQESYAAMEQYLCSVGRNYLIKAIYAELVKTQEGHQLADKIYAKAKAGYHSITRQSIERVLSKPGG
jgi:aminopeptidase N